MTHQRLVPFLALSVLCGFALVLLRSPSPAAADRPLVAPTEKTVASPNGTYEAVLDPATWTTTVYLVGVAGRRERRWAMVGWFRVFHLADDGEHVVIGYDGANLLALDHAPDEVVLRFVRRGELLANVGLDEVLRDPQALRRTASHYAWRNQEGFDDTGRFVLETVDGVRHVFDPTTGRPAGADDDAD